MSPVPPAPSRAHVVTMCPWPVAWWDGLRARCRLGIAALRRTGATPPIPMDHHQILSTGLHTMPDHRHFVCLPFPQTDLPDAWYVESQGLFELLEPYHHLLH